MKHPLAQPNQASTLGFKFSRWPELPRNIGSALSFSCFVVSGLKAVKLKWGELNNKWWTAEWLSLLPFDNPSKMLGQQHKPMHYRGAFVIVLFYHHLHSLSHAFYARSALGFRDFMWSSWGLGDLDQQNHYWQTDAKSVSTCLYSTVVFCWPFQNWFHLECYKRLRLVVKGNCAVQFIQAHQVTMEQQVLWKYYA